MQETLSRKRNILRRNMNYSITQIFIIITGLSVFRVKN